jgi:hypothetical protein
MVIVRVNLMSVQMSVQWKSLIERQTLCRLASGRSKMVCQAGISFDQNCVLLKTSRLTFNLEWRSCIVVAVCLCCAALRPRMSCKSKNLCIVVEVSSVRAVGGKSLISVVIVVENSFRSSNGRSSIP